MKLVPKLAVAFIAVAAGILTANGFRRVHRESSTFRADHERDVRVVARAMAGAAAAAWKAAGERAALATIEQPREQPVRVRWICASDERRPEGEGIACGDVASMPEESAVTVLGHDPSGDERRYAYAPVDIDGVRRGAIEVSDSLETELGFAHRTLIDTVLTAIMMSGIFAGVSVLLSVWLVARPTQALVAKARRVGKGDFTGPLAMDRRDEFGDLAGEMNAMCERLASAMEQLRHADRLTTVGKLASGIAHELGTPLNVIEARASMIAAGEAEGPQAREYAAIVVDATERMTRIIRQLLAFARRRGPEKSACDLVDMASRSVDLVEPIARKAGVAVRVTSRSGRFEVAADTMQLQQALTNLIVNAIHASGQGGEVEVAVGVERAEPPPDVATADGEYACVRVIDRGKGIAREVLEHVFEPFFTTKDVGEGTGLGLSVAYGIVKDHGGWIAVESEVGRGSRFSIFLPRTTDDEAKVAAAAAEQGAMA